MSHFNAVEQVAVYDVRSRPPNAQDAIFAAELGATAGCLAAQGTFGRMVTLQQGCITHVPLSEARSGRMVGIEHYDPDAMRKRNLPPSIVAELLKARAGTEQVLGRQT